MIAHRTSIDRVNANGSGTVKLRRSSTIDPSFRTHTTINGITYKTATRREEFAMAFQLVFESYLKSNLIGPNPYRMRVTPFHLQPTTDVFVAMHEGRVISTMSLVHDTEHRLPMDVVYGPEVDAIRDRGPELAEISCLASQKGYFGRSRMFDIFVRLISLVGQSARHNGIDQMLLAVHPRHYRFYNRFFGCEQFGDERSYSTVGNKPAVACLHDFAHLDKHKYHLYEQTYAYRFRPWETARQPMDRANLDYFGPVAEHCTGYATVAA